MKRLLTVLALTGSAVMGVTAVTANAAEPTGSAAAHLAEPKGSAIDAYFYTQPNYGGVQSQWWIGGTNTFFEQPMKSVINHTSKDMCGFNDYDHSIKYKFWKGGSWNYIGAPFSDSKPFMWASWIMSC
ncbi:hypothetical protein AB0D57_44585 [Streptomyces sp. NPDC048275]|uniref:hypothetical protein n=1 Tax=Streptomyces sp. NPDC048275 TaxID=3155629 RepID=UPI003405AF1B